MSGTDSTRPHQRRWEGQFLALEAVLGGGCLLLVLGTLLGIGPTGLASAGAVALTVLTALTVGWHWTVESIGRTTPLETGSQSSSLGLALRWAQRVLLVVLVAGTVLLVLSIGGSGDRLTGPNSALGDLWLSGWVVFLGLVTLRAVSGLRASGHT